MEQDSGWIEILDPETNGEVARAHLMIERPSIGGSDWEGSLLSVHSVTGDTLASGRYLVRFESGGQVCCIDVDGEAEPPRVRGREFPAILKELHASD